MKHKSLKFVTIFTSILVALFAVGASAQDRRALAAAKRVTGDIFTAATRTRGGAEVYAVEPPSQAMLNAVDKGLIDLFGVARKNGHSRRLNPADYTIFIAKADRQRDSSGKYSPDIAVGAAQYAGTHYDQGGYIFAAGMVISNNPLSFVIANHTTDFARVSDLVRYEGEHLVLYHNDRRRYEMTKDHSKGGGHPILQ